VIKKASEGKKMDRFRAKMKMRENEQAEMGVGTLIVFIAMIIVAAVAATVLITTAFEMQQQAEKTGEIAIMDVATGFKIVNIAGDRSNGAIDDSIINILQVKVGLLAGSPDINVSDVIIELSDGTTDVTVKWVDTGAAAATWYASADADEFECRNLRDMAPTNSSWAYSMMTAGDIALFYIDCNETGLALSTQTTCSLKIIPKHGIPTLGEFTTPAVYSTRYVSLI